MKNIHLLPTNQPSKYVTNYMEQTMQWQNIYITSDEEIKEGDWYWLEKVGEIGSNSGFYKSTTEKSSKLNTISSNCKKIILTTDGDLIKDGIQAIDVDFLEWFVKNPSCDEVDVKKGFRDGTAYGYNFLDYKIIIPKEEPKQELYVEKGLDYMINLEEPKQKTLEEAAERLYPIILEDDGWDKNKQYRDEWIEGAKWQQNDCVQFINKLEDDSFDGWSEEAINGYLTACITIKNKLKLK